MTNKNPQISNKQLLIDKLKQLVKGEITKNELKPANLCMMIGWGEDDQGNDTNLYLVNSVSVDRETWDKALSDNRRHYGTGTFAIEYD